MSKLGVAVLAIHATAALPVLANLTVQVDKLDPTDGFPMPENNLVVIDVSVNVSTDDAWAALGIAAFALNGATLVYAHDPNDAHVLYTAPGPENRFSTFFSRPRGRNGTLRFEQESMVQLTGSYCIGPSAVFAPNRVDAGVRPSTPEFGRSGYVARIVIDLAGVNDPLFRSDSASIVLASEPPPDSVALLETFCGSMEYGLLVGSWNGSSGLPAGFGIYGLIPEPAPLALLFGAIWIVRH